jgi:hypothetical protein
MVRLRVRPASPARPLGHSRDGVSTILSAVSSKAGSLLSRIALAVGATLSILAVAEGALRLVAWRNERAQRAAREAWRAAHPEAQDLPQLAGVLELAQRNRLGVHKGVVIRTNDRGLRGPNFAPRPSPGTFRIALGGDSFTFGSGAAEPDVYASRLGALLDRLRPGTHHEVINAGLAGAHVHGVMDRLARVIDAYAPDLLVYGFTINDLEGPRYELTEHDAEARAWLAWAGGHPLYLVRWSTWRLLTLRAGGDPSRDAYVRELMLNADPAAPAWGEFERGLDRLVALAEASNVCAHVFLHTHLTDLDEAHPFTPIYDRVERAARARGLGVTASLADFRGRDPSSLWISAVDSHPNAEGHRILAEALARGLTSLPDACWVRPEAMQETATGPG